jgi:hypothetical protein
MENDLFDQFNCLAWGWDIIGGREYEASTSESSEMVTALLLEKIQQHFRTGHCPVISNLAHSIW